MLLRAQGGAPNSRKRTRNSSEEQGGGGGEAWPEAAADTQPGGGEADAQQAVEAPAAEGKPTGTAPAPQKVCCAAPLPATRSPKLLAPNRGR